MKRLVIFLMWIPIVSWSQIVPSSVFPLYDRAGGDTVFHTVQITAGHLQASGTLHTRFVNALFQNEYIDHHLKSTISPLRRNYFLSDSRLAISWSRVAFREGKSWNSGFGFKMEERYFSHALFTNDYFRLLFYGNASFAGSSAVLDHSVAGYLHYRMVSLGWINSLQTANGRWDINVSMSLLDGLQMNELRFGKASIYTAPYGETVQFTGAYHYFSSDTTGSASAALNGAGLAGSLYIARTDKDGKSRISFLIDQAGGIWWNDQSLYVSNDTTRQWEGTPISFLPEPVLDAGNEFDRDALMQAFYYSKSSKGQRFERVPFHLLLSWENLSGQKWGVDEITLGAYPDRILFFYARAGLRYRWSGGSKAGIQVVAIQGGRYSLSTTGSLLFTQKLALTWHFAGLEGLLIPEKSYTMQAGLGLHYSY
jgi:hypothetical protein